MSKRSSEVASDILKDCKRLCDQALQADLDVLAHLLSMATLQAERDSTASRLSGRSPRKRA